MGVAESGAHRDDPAALGQLVVNRVHYTYSVQDLYTFREDYRYVYSEVGSLRKLPLLWREREIQANMVTLDAANRNLVYLPSAEVITITQGYLRNLWSWFVNSLPPAQQASLTPLLSDILLVTRFDPTGTEIETAENALGQLEGISPPPSRVRELTEFARLLQGYYIPFVQIENAGSSEYLFVRHGVDVFLPYRKERATERRRTAVSDYSLYEILKFLFTGMIHFDVPIPIIAFHLPPWSSTEALHMKVNLPAGLEVRGKPRGLPASLFTETKILELASRDETSIYLYVSKRDGNELLSRRVRASIELEEFAKFFHDQLEQFRKEEEKPLLTVLRAVVGGLLEIRRKIRKLREAVRPEIRVRAKMGVGMGSLLLLLWSVVGVAYRYDIPSGLGLSDYLAILGILFVIVLSIAVYSIEKPYLRLPIFSHVLAASLCLLNLPILRAIVSLLRG